MAVDLMVMPLSRYWSGDYITPAMRFAWEQGIPYTQFMPDGPRTFPPGAPYGGLDAPAERARLFERTIPGLLAWVKTATTESLWDEHADDEPCFHRPSNSAIAALMGAATKLAPHLAAAIIHLPVHFPDPLDAEGMIFGSLFALEHELATNRWPDAASDAVEAFHAAISDAKRLGLPLIVDT